MNTHPRFEKRMEQLHSMREAASTPGISIVPYEDMTEFGKNLFESDSSFAIEVDPGEVEYKHASDHVKAWQAQYRDSTSPIVKAKLKKRIDENTGVPYSQESHYLALRYIAEQDAAMKVRISDQMYGKDHVLDIPDDLDAAIQGLMTH